jgi:cyclin-dependent kinase 7
VLELCATDLEAVVKDKSFELTPADYKAYLLMTLTGLQFLHHNFILHRDLKPNNLFISNKGILKIADFGLATYFGSPNRNFTSQVVTIWLLV